MAAACFSKMARCAPERKVKLLPPPHRPPVLRLLRLLVWRGGLWGGGWFGESRFGGGLGGGGMWRPYRTRDDVLGVDVGRCARLVWSCAVGAQAGSAVWVLRGRDIPPFQGLGIFCYGGRCPRLV